MENIIELSEKESLEIEGGSWFAIGLMVIAPGLGFFALGVEEGIRQASK